MAKGFFTQTVVLLTNGQTTLAEVKSALGENGYHIVREAPAQESLAFSGPGLLIEYKPETNGYLSVDIVDQQWPDEMGDPQTDAIIFGAWSMGYFGPFAFPGGLARAAEQAWIWPGGRVVSETHRGFIRLRISYVFGADPNAPVLPDDYDPVDELLFLNGALEQVLRIAGVLCYFNPNGEVLVNAAVLNEVRSACSEQGHLPLALWSNVRFYNLNESLGFMDTVGNGQLNVTDVEAIFPLAEFDPNHVANYLRNVTEYLLGLERELHSGEHIDGPGETGLSWTTEAIENGINAPPRRVLRLFPKKDSGSIRSALATIQTAQQ